MIKKFALCTAAALAVLPLTTQAQVDPGACGCMDIVLVVDTTGSMGPAIGNVIAGLNNIVTTAQTASGADLYMALVTFQDTINVDLPLTDSGTDASAITTAIGLMSIGGGGNFPESSDEALNYVATGSSACIVTGALGNLRPGCVRIAVLVTDALPAGCDDTYTVTVDDVNAQNVANAAASAGLLISAVQVLDGFDGGDATETPIMNAYASTTGGSYVAVPADGSGTADAIVGIIADCGTAANACPRSQGFWKNHEEVWPVASLYIGGAEYSQADLLAVLRAPVKGNAVLILAKQLIAAELNIANGSDPTVVTAARAAAHALFTGLDIRTAVVKTSTAKGKAMTSAAGVLDQYNNRLLTPDCEGGESEGEEEVE